MPFGKRFWRRHRSRRRMHGKHAYCPKCTPPACTLAEVPPGCRARVTGFSNHLSADRFAYLQAYGLVPGYWIRVIQHSPVVVVQIDHTELALELDLAANVNVAEIENSPRPHYFS